MKVAEVESMVYMTKKREKPKLFNSVQFSCVVPIHKIIPRHFKEKAHKS